MKGRILTVYKIENPIDIREAETEAEIIRFKFRDQDLEIQQTV